jgi:predicted MFS family arabinose efflux permease
MSTQALDAPLGCTSANSAGPTPAVHWSAVLAMTLCVFALIASEFMPVSLLTPIATDLGVSEGRVGQGIAISGAFAVLMSLFVARLAGGVNRRTLLLGLTGLMALSGAVVALAPNYGVYMLGRALIGVVVGGFWSLSAATAMRLVPAPQVPRALAIFNGGNALATVVAAPLGSYLGAIIGWRGAFFGLVPVGLVALVWQWITLPSMPAQPRQGNSGNVFELLKNRAVALGMLAVSMFFMGQFALFTYVRPFLETVTKVDAARLPLMLLTLGVAGLVGTTLIGRLLKWNFFGTLVAIPILMALIALALTVLGSSVAAVAVLLGLWGLVATAAPVGWWAWLARTLPGDAEAGGGLMVAVVQLAIALGSTVGGWLFDASGYQGAFAASAGMLVVASLVTLLTARSQASKAA